MAASGSCTDSGITFFDRLAEENMEERSPAGGGEWTKLHCMNEMTVLLMLGVISNIFGRFWRPQIATNHQTVGSATFDNGCAPAAADEDSGEVDPSSTSKASSTASNNIPSNSVRGLFILDLITAYILLIKDEDEFGASTQISNPSTSQYWMPDSTGKECYQCEERFSTFRLVFSSHLSVVLLHCYCKLLVEEDITVVFVVRYSVQNAVTSICQDVL
uniref:C2H2-type domain-containing protein n=1 Tax=Angiostrongylus cantonensis TaxID=6313 RepID=A0A0K0CX96_ANGCA